MANDFKDELALMINNKLSTAQARNGLHSLQANENPIFVNKASRFLKQKTKSRHIYLNPYRMLGSVYVICKNILFNREAV